MRVHTSGHYHANKDFVQRFDKVLAFIAVLASYHDDVADVRHQRKHFIGLPRLIITTAIRTIYKQYDCTVKQFLIAFERNNENLAIGIGEPGLGASACPGDKALIQLAPEKMTK